MPMRRVHYGRQGAQMKQELRYVLTHTPSPNVMQLDGYGWWLNHEVLGGPVGPKIM